MYDPDRSQQPDATSRSGAYLTAEELRELVGLMRELRNATLSRGTFASATNFIGRFAGETHETSVVAAEGWRL